MAPHSGLRLARLDLTVTAMTGDDLGQFAQRARANAIIGFDAYLMLEDAMDAAAFVWDLGGLAVGLPVVLVDELQRLRVSGLL